MSDDVDSKSPTTPMIGLSSSPGGLINFGEGSTVVVDADEEVAHVPEDNGSGSRCQQDFVYASDTDIELTS